MTLRLLAALPVPLAGLAVLLIVGLGSPGHHDLLFRVEGTAVKALAALGAVAAALAFAPRSRLRIAWAAFALSYTLLAAKTAPVIGDDLLFARVGTLAANVLAPLGAALMVRAWFSSGLNPAIPAVQRRTLPLLAFAGALAAAGPGVAVQVRNLEHDATAWLLVVSGLGDVAAITLLAPLLVIAHAMRGGRLVWPWALLAAGQLCWLLYDVVPSISSALSAPALAGRVASEVLRASACLFHASAGLAQGLALRPVPSAMQGLLRPQGAPGVLRSGPRE